MKSKKKVTKPALSSMRSEETMAMWEQWVPKKIPRFIKPAVLRSHYESQVGYYNMNRVNGTRKYYPKSKSPLVQAKVATFVTALLDDKDQWRFTVGYNNKFLTAEQLQAKLMVILMTGDK